MGQSRQQMWDVFLSHASEDKEAFARPLADKLIEKGLRVWFDAFTLELGDRLLEKIDEGLAKSRFGVVVLSEQFFDKKWTQYELREMLEREVWGVKVILPVLHGINHDYLSLKDKGLAEKTTVSTSQGLDEVTRQILAVVGTRTNTLRFANSLHADLVTAKVTVVDLLEMDTAIEVRWPSAFEEMLKEVEFLRQEAERCHEQDSCFHGVDGQIVANFIDTARLAISHADKIRTNVPARVPFLVSGMSDYWGGQYPVIEKSLVNFLTLACFEAQFRLAYCFCYIAVNDRMPSGWEYWLDYYPYTNQRYARLFAVDEQMWSGRVLSIGDAEIDQYVWGPSWMIQDAAEKSDSNKPITNPLFSQYLIPQIELRLALLSDLSKIVYRERAEIGEILDISGKERTYGEHLI